MPFPSRMRYILRLYAWRNHHQMMSSKIILSINKVSYRDPASFALFSVLAENLSNIPHCFSNYTSTLFEEDVILRALFPERLSVILVVASDWASITEMTLYTTPAGLDERHEFILQVVAEQEYLGISLSCNRLTDTSKIARYEAVTKRLAVLRTIRLHGRKYIAATCVCLYKALVRPMVDYHSSLDKSD